jgi:hypothetical protein
MWRIALDYVWYPDESELTMHDGQTFGAKQFCNKFATSIMSYMTSAGCTTVSNFWQCTPLSNAMQSVGGQCNSKVGASVTSVNQPQFNGFLYGPLVATLVVPVAGYESVQQSYLRKLVEWGASHYSTLTTADYFPLSQLTFSYLLIAGKFTKPI